MNTILSYQGVSIQLTENATQIGIEKSLELIRFVGGIYQDLKDALSDGRLSWTEGLRLGFGLRGITTIIQNLERLQAEIQDLSLEEFGALATEAVRAFGVQGQEDNLAFMQNKVLPILANVINIYRISQS